LRDLVEVHNFYNTLFTCCVRLTIDENNLSVVAKIYKCFVTDYRLHSHLSAVVENITVIQGY